jgi:hypothetical protein
MTTVEFYKDIVKDRLKQFNYDESQVVFASEVENTFDPYCTFNENETYHRCQSHQTYKPLPFPNNDMPDDILWLILTQERRKIQFETFSAFVKAFKNISSTQPVEQEEIMEVFTLLRNQNIIDFEPTTGPITLKYFYFCKEINEAYKEALNRPAFLSELQRLENNAKILKHAIVSDIGEYVYSRVNGFGARLYTDKSN